MARQIRWETLNPIAPTNTLLTQGNELMSRGLSGLADSAKQFGTDVRNQNTNALLQQAMAVDSLGALPEARQNILAQIASQGNGVDSVKAMEALNAQQRNLYANQTSENQLDQYSRNVAAEQRGLADIAKYKDPALTQALLTGDTTTLANYASQFNDPTSLLDRTLTSQKSAEDRTQRVFTNNLAAQSADLELSKGLNPNAGQANATTYHTDAAGNVVETTSYNPALADTYLGVASARRADGSVDLGATASQAATTASSNTGPTSAGSTSGKVHPNAKAVQSNLLSLSKNINSNPQLASAIGKMNPAPKHLAMMAIESNGGGMQTDSGSSVGPMQINKKYAAGNAKKYGISGDPTKDINANIALGMAMLDDYDNQFKGNNDAIGIAYNGGEYAAKAAYNAWNSAGQKGKVRDYIPKTYPQGGKNVNYSEASRKQMYNHADKYDRALTAWNSGKSNSGTTKSNSKTASAGPKSFSLAPGALANAQQSYATSRGSAIEKLNSSNEAGNSPEAVNNLANFIEDNKINTAGSTVNSLRRDEQNMYNVLTSRDDWAGLNAQEKLTALKEAISYSNKNQGWFIGVNPNDTKVNARVSRALDTVMDKATQGKRSAEYTELMKSATNLMKSSKGVKGKPPTLDQAMQLIDAPLYNRYREDRSKRKGPQIDNPFFTNN